MDTKKKTIRKILLAKKLQNATKERQVERHYSTALEKIYPNCISYPHKCDGLLINEDISVIMEFKFNLDFKDSRQQAIAIIQVLYYLKKMEIAGEKIPMCVLIGDVNECFVFATSKITNYLKSDVDWSIAPSTAANNNPALVREIAKDKNIEPFIYDVDDNFDLLLVIEKMKNISQGKPYSITITKDNIVPIFRCFKQNVVRDKKFKSVDIFRSEEDESKRISDIADIFFTCLTASKEVFPHPKKKRTIVVRGKEIVVNIKNFRAFCSQFKMEYTPIELEEITANKDRILRDTHRRRTGAFFTPDIWVAEAHKMIAEQFGENWKEEYVVWDCACGTANLTRGYKFEELYISTLDESDINTIKDCGYNPEATVFQYDFLDEVGIDRVPESLRKAFEDGKKVLFLINPPYGTASGNKSKEKIKTNIAVNNTQKKMVALKYGDAQKQLYTQFIYKIIGLDKKYNSNIIVSIFSPTAFLTGRYYKKFRINFLDHFSIADAYLINSQEFADVKSAWGLSFSVWKNEVSSIKNEFRFKIKRINKDNFEIEDLPDKIVYNINPVNDASYWIRTGIKGYNKFDAPQLSSSIKIRKDGGGKMCDNSIGYIYCAGNSVQTNNTNISLFSSCFHGNSQGFAFCKEDFIKIVSYLTARKSIKPTWINCKDEYLVPNIEHPDYEQWNNDAIVYSLFNNSSQQSSLRDIDYKDKKWDIVNNFFFMSNTEMRDMANTGNYKEMYQDTKVFDEDRYVYTLLQETTLSDDAQQVLDMAMDLMRKSFEEREDYNDEHPEYNLQCWDAGWAQLKPMLKERFKEEHDAFVVVYKKFEDRMREGVYKFGFLKE